MSGSCPHVSTGLAPRSWHAPSAAPAATGSAGGRTGDAVPSRLGCRTDLALAAQASGFGGDLEKGEGRDGGRQVGVERKAGVNVKDKSAGMCPRGS